MGERERKILAFLVEVKKIHFDFRPADGKWVIKPTDPGRNFSFQFEPFVCE